MERPQAARIALAIVLILHVVGRVGLELSEWSRSFAELSGVTLLITGSLALLFHRGPVKLLFSLLWGIAAAGFAAEWAGVHTGFPFGEYSYTERLGWGWGGVPFLIAFNWAVLLYAFHQGLKYSTQPLLLKALLAALAMTLFDALLEPFAIRFGLWAWAGRGVPIQNYLAWFGLSFLLYLPLGLWEKSQPNLVALGCVAVEAVFLGSFLVG